MLKKELIVATHNPNKAIEIMRILNDRFLIKTLSDAGIKEKIPEPFDTLEENARQKSSTIFRLTGKDCFGEDTGLEVKVLNNAPGVRSARYSGETATDLENTRKLLGELSGHNNRNARFRTVISLIVNGQEFQFEGICEGVISSIAKGTNGFGYDPVFIPTGDSRTFAEMEGLDKDKFSHRRKALEKMGAFLEKFDFH